MNFKVLVVGAEAKAIAERFNEGAFTKIGDIYVFELVTNRGKVIVNISDTFQEEHDAEIIVINLECTFINAQIIVKNKITFVTANCSRVFLFVLKELIDDNLTILFEPSPQQQISSLFVKQFAGGDVRYTRDLNREIDIKFLINFGLPVL